MKSAYQVLGVPANAAPEEIQAAFDRVQAHYTREKLATEDGAVDRFNEARTAFQVLRDPQSRTAHDRKLTMPSAAAGRTLAMAPEPAAPSTVARMFWTGIVLVVLLFAGGGYLAARNSELRAKAAAAEKAAAEIRAREEKERMEAEARQEDRMRREAARADAAERRLRYESHSIAADQNWRSARAEESAAQQRRQEAMALETARANEERRQQYEAQRRAAEDQRRVRELCWNNYGRPNC
jgi:curved DNA-binding protein CbpA